MFAGLILIPAVRQDRVADFLRWYHWSGGYAKQLGFPERSLLKERGAQGYAILEEHVRYDHLLAMLNHPFRQQAWRRLAPLLEGRAVSRIYYTMLNRGVNGVSRFVNLVFFPPVREGKDVEFRRWFWRSGASHRRRLLWPVEGGNYAAVMEHDGSHELPDMQAQEWAAPLLDGDPCPLSFERA